MEGVQRIPHLGLALCSILLAIGKSNAVCSAPALTSKMYALTASSNIFSTGATFDVYCYPEYEQTGDATLTCQSSGSWDPALPSCSSTGYAPWWALLLGIFCGILVICCVVPRLWFCICPNSKIEPGNFGTDTLQGGVTGKDSTASRSEWQRRDHPENNMRQRQEMAAFYNNTDPAELKKAEAGMQF